MGGRVERRRSHGGRASDSVFGLMEELGTRCLYPFLYTYMPDSGPLYVVAIENDMDKCGGITPNTSRAVHGPSH